mmetsp:Transcript_27881/g.38541  ORF Transcript_27881/g.38541 Transcript_27881/m.38541 type:complete len:376 (+) Transcript_27881:175-1302(+)
MKMKVNSLIFLMLVQSILVLALGNTTPEMNLEANLHRLVTTAHSHLKSHIASALAGSRESAAGGQVMGSRKVAAGSSSKSDHLSSGPSATRAHIKGAQDPDTAVPVSAHDSNPSATMANAGLVIPHAAQLLVNPTSMGQAEAASRGYISCPGPFCPHNTVAPGKDENSCTTIYSEYVHCMRKYGKAARAGKCKVLTEKHAKCKEAGGVQSNLGAPGGGMMGAVAGAGTQVPGQKIPGSVGGAGGILGTTVIGANFAMPGSADVICPGPLCPTASTSAATSSCEPLEKAYTNCVGRRNAKEMRRTKCKHQHEALGKCHASPPLAGQGGVGSVLPVTGVGSANGMMPEAGSFGTNGISQLLNSAASAGLAVPSRNHG